MDTEKNNSFPSNWLWLLPILMLYLRKGSTKLNIYEIDTNSMEKKARLLNRIKGYMSSEEQLIIHRTEMLLQIISKVKVMMETPDILNSSTYSSLSIEDKKKNMLLDISEFVDADKQDIIYKSIDVHSKIHHMGNKLQEIKSLDTQSITIETVEKYIELFDPILEGQLQGRTKELKALVGVIKLFKSMETKGQLDETDLIEIIKPFVSQEQGDQLTRMIQLVKVFSAINNESSEESKILEENMTKEGAKDQEEKDISNSMEPKEIEISPESKNP